ncbi:hypothetical protein [Vibrio crassostreae]|uniref:hypothetical protein n=1 Tax=Vibrio crassostreae TaxID=246167 RepID=UPI001B309335|nr:hypothetical protein [Vibrio crassostreae]
MSDTKNNIAQEIANLKAVQNNTAHQGGVALSDGDTGERIEINMSAIQSAKTEEDLHKAMSAIREQANTPDKEPQASVSDEQKQETLTNDIAAIQSKIKHEVKIDKSEVIPPQSTKDKITEVFIAVRLLVCLLAITYFINHYLEGTVKYGSSNVHTTYLYVATLFTFGLGVFQAHSNRVINGLDEVGSLEKIGIYKAYAARSYAVLVGFYAIFFNIFN